MVRSVPQIISLAAIAVGFVLFGLTLLYIDFDETLESASRLGLRLPVILIPGACWQVLRTWGWAVAFPDDARPAFTRLFRVRLASDAIGFFTVRGLAGEPLKVVLLYDRVAPEISTASIAVERTAFAIVSVAVAALVSLAAVTRLQLPGAWDTLFALFMAVSVVLLALVAFIVRRRSGDYLAIAIAWLDRVTGRRLETSRIIRFILDVERVILELLRGHPRRLLILTCLPVVCYLLMTIEVWLVFWAIDQPIGITQGLTIETFARVVSIASAAIPGNLGALEVSNAAVVAALGLSGGGSLALTRRIRALLWAAAGLVLYPRVQERRQ